MARRAEKGAINLRPVWFTNLFTNDLLDHKISADMDATNSNPASLLMACMHDPNSYFIKETIGAPQPAHNMAAFARPGPPSLTLSALMGGDGGAARETRIFRETATAGGATNRRSDLSMNSPNGRMRIARHEVAAQCRGTVEKMIKKVPAGRLNFSRTTTAHECGTTPHHERMGLRHAPRDAAMGDASYVYDAQYDAQNRQVRKIITNGELTGNVHCVPCAMKKWEKKHPDKKGGGKDDTGGRF